MIDLTRLERLFLSHFPGCNFPLIKERINEQLQAKRNNRLQEWEELIENLPAVEVNRINFNDRAITIEPAKPLSEVQRTALKTELFKLHPWRKGPYRLFDIHIDTEWRSDLKWNRLYPFLPDLKGKRVLDVGCGNGYHCWRMAGEKAKLVIGVDPYLLSIAQFYVIRHFTGNQPVHLLPLASEDLPDIDLSFDVVFSMGVLYHRKSPIDHLYELRSILKPGAILILETLVIEEKAGQVLFPKDRYAKMRNVWFIPSCSMLETWLSRCGFRNIRLLDVTKTTTEEQRSTEWMQFESLKDFLDEKNPELTVEGYPSPRRAIYMATLP